MKRIDGIQVLRAIAALLVSTYHIDYIFKLGLNTVIGVDIFFVISGFIIMYTTQKNIDNFIIKRVSKIIPLYWILTLLTFIAAKTITGIVPYTPNFIDLIKSMFFIPFYRSAIRGGDAIRPLVGPAHTLLLEIFFYAVFYISAKISHKNRGLISAIVLALLSITGMIFNLSNSAILTMWTSKYIVEFALGIVLFYMYNKYKKDMKTSLFKEKISIIISTILILVLVFNKFEIFIVRALIVSLIVLLNITSFDKLKAPKILIEIGNISYSYFLIHYYIILLVKKIFCTMNCLTVTSVLYTILAIVCSLLVAKVSYELIEVRMSKKIKKLFIKKQI